MSPPRQGTAKKRITRLKYKEKILPYLKNQLGEGMGESAEQGILVVRVRRRKIK